MSIATEQKIIDLESRIVMLEQKSAVLSNAHSELRGELLAMASVVRQLEAKKRG